MRRLEGHAPHVFYAIVINEPPSCIGFPRWRPHTFLSQLPPGHTAQAATAAHPLVRKALRYATTEKRLADRGVVFKKTPRRGKA